MATILMLTRAKFKPIKQSKTNMNIKDIPTKTFYIWLTTIAIINIYIFLHLINLI